MPTFDFRARQLRVNQIINSGSAATDPLLVYGLGSATNVAGGYDTSHFTYGSDTWMFISGTVGSADSAGSRGTVVLKGDLVTSGVIQVADLPGAFSISTPAANKGTVYAKTGTLYFKNDSGVEYDLTEVGSAGSSAGRWNELSPSPRLNTTASVAIAGQDGTAIAAQSKGTDIFFYVTGTDLTRVSLFGGSVITSGTLRVKSASGDVVFTANPLGVVSGSSDFSAGGNITSAGNLNVNGGSILTTASTLTIAPNNASRVEIGLVATQVQIGANTGPSLTTVKDDLLIDGDAVASGSISTKNVAGSTVFIATNSGVISGSSNLQVGGNATIAGNLTIDGLATTIGNSSSDRLFVSASVETNILPSIDSTFNLGSPARRWANVYTGDLHLRNDRGDWTVIEESDFLRIVNNRTGKNFKLLMEPID